MNKRMISVVLVGLFCLPLLWRCATIMNLEGGPRDSIPPRLVAVTPADHGTDFTAREIYLAFDEFVQLKDQQKEFFTSPRMKKTPQLLIRGRGVAIRLKDTLKENTTYALNFGSALADNNEGNPLRGLRYVFSTGPEIDSLNVSGYTEDSYKADSVPSSFVWFFPADSVQNAVGSQRDSVMLLRDTTNQPLYMPAVIGRAMPNGVFFAQNLKPIPYRVYAFEDTNSNQFYDAGTDKIGFLSDPVNPEELPEFGLWYDSLRMYVTAQPQLYFRMFLDASARRQSLREHTRPSQHRGQMIFGAGFPQIDTILWENYADRDVVLESTARERDTLSLWFNRPSADIPDTIRGRMVYHRWVDSLKSNRVDTAKLTFAWRAVESREQERERERIEKERQKAEEAGETYTEPPKPNAFKAVFTPGSGTVTPRTQLSVLFDYPLIRLDTAAVTLTRTVEEESEELKITWRKDTVSMQRLHLDIPWRVGGKYRLTALQGAFEDMARQQNDSLSLNFDGVDSMRTGTLLFKIAAPAQARYIVEVLSDGGGTLARRDQVQAGLLRIPFLPAGDFRIRVTEDVNANGRWDTGNLAERRQPERSEYVRNAKDEELFTAREGWEVEVEADMAKVFAPVTMESLWQTLEARERRRLQKLAEDRAKAVAKGTPQPQQSPQAGVGAGFNSLRSGLQ